MEMDKSFGGDLSQFQAIIHKYETLFVELTQELHSVKSDHDSVKSKLSALLIENQTLSKELNKLQTPQQTELISDNDEIIECLKQQIKTLLKEKEHISQLWQNATKSIEILEGELRIFQSGTENFIPKTDLLKVKQNYELHLKDLEHKLHAAEKKLLDSSKDVSKIDSKNPTKSCINLTLENQAGALKIVKNLEAEVLVLQKRLQESEKSLAKCQRMVKEKDEALANITKKNNEYREKVGEALQVVQAALNEKDAALFREKEAKDEIEKVSKELVDIMKETEGKINHEVAMVKKECAKKEESFQTEIRKLEKEISLKLLENEKNSTKCSLLDHELERFRKGNITMDDMHTSKLLLLEKNLESTFQKLLLSEKNNIQLASEKETIKSDMLQMAEHYERTLKTKDVEKLTFQTRLKQFQNDLEETKFTLTNIKEQLEMEKEGKKLMEKEWMKEKDEQEKLLTKTLTVKLNDTTANFNEKIAQLQLQLDFKDQINKKWSTETKTIVQSLEKLVANLKKELNKSKKENKILKSDLYDERQKFEQYQGFLQIINNDVNKITQMARENAENGV